MKDLDIVFHDTALGEVNRTLLDMGLLDVSNIALNDPAIHKLLMSLSEIFSIELPELSGDVEKDLTRVSRDINLSRLFRNRGIMLFYRLVNEKVDGVPIFQYFNHPYEERPFRNMTEFVDWFSHDAHISRDIIFRNMAAIDRALQVGITLEQSYEYLNKYAHAFRETLKNVLEWDDDTRRKLVGINPDIALSIVNQLDPSNIDMIMPLIDSAKLNPEKSNGKLVDAMKPYIRQLLDEVTSQDTAKDAMKFVKHDILTKPEIKYRWISEGGYIEISLTRTSLADTGEKFTERIDVVNLLIDSPSIPKEVIQDLVTRLPIVNRQAVYLDI